MYLFARLKQRKRLETPITLVGKLIVYIQRYEKVPNVVQET